MCSKCRVRKPTAKFENSLKFSDGFRPWCKTCVNSADEFNTFLQSVTIDEMVSIIPGYVLANLSDMRAKSLAVYLNRLAEDQMIVSWKSNTATGQIAVKLLKSMELAFEANFHQRPKGILE